MSVAEYSIRAAYPFALGKSEGITTCFKQKGVEFDPFKIRVVYLLPQPKKLNRAAVSQPVFHNIFGLVRILLNDAISVREM